MNSKPLLVDGKRATIRVFCLAECDPMIVKMAPPKLIVCSEVFDTDKLTKENYFTDY